MHLYTLRLRNSPVTSFSSFLYTSEKPFDVKDLTGKYGNMSAQGASESANLNYILGSLFVPRRLETFSYVGLPKLSRSLTKQLMPGMP